MQAKRTDSNIRIVKKSVKLASGRSARKHNRIS